MTRPINLSLAHLPNKVLDEQVWGKATDQVPAEQAYEAGDWPSTRRASLQGGATNKVRAKQVYEADQTTKKICKEDTQADVMGPLWP